MSTLLLDINDNLTNIIGRTTCALSLPFIIGDSSILIYKQGEYNFQTAWFIINICFILLHSLIIIRYICQKSASYLITIVFYIIAIVNFSMMIRCFILYHNVHWMTIFLYAISMIYLIEILIIILVNIAVYLKRYWSYRKFNQESKVNLVNNDELI